MGWSGDVTGAVNPTQVTLDANREITATFRRLLFLPVVMR